MERRAEEPQYPSTDRGGPQTSWSSKQEPKNGLRPVPYRCLYQKLLAKIELWKCALVQALLWQPTFICWAFAGRRGDSGCANTSLFPARDANGMQDKLAAAGVIHDTLNEIMLYFASPSIFWPYRKACPTKWQVLRCRQYKIVAQVQRSSIR